MRLVAGVARFGVLAWIGVATQIGVVALVAGLGWGMVGCGADSVRALAGGGGELILADQVTETHYRLSVADGAMTLTGIGTEGTVSTEAGFVDEVTGARYSLAVSGGALTLVPGPDWGASTNPGGTAGLEIGLADTETAKTYELTVSAGALTLVSNDGDER